MDDMDRTQMQPCIELGNANLLPDGSPKLLASRIDHLATHQPHRIYAVVPRDINDLSKGYFNVTYEKFANMINTAAWWLDSVLPVISTDSSDYKITYWGPSDLCYAVMIVASIKVSRQILLSSFWCSFDGLTKLFDQTNCRIFLSQTSPGKGTNFERLAELRPDIQQIRVPNVDHWLNSPTCQHYPYDLSYCTVADRVALILHTSGTTSTPKPIVYTNRRLALFGVYRFLADIDRSVRAPRFTHQRHHTNLFICHAGGLAYTLIFPVYFEMEVVIAAPNDGVTSEYAHEILETSGVSCVLYSPGLLEPMTRNSATLSMLRKLDLVSTGAAPISTGVMDSIHAEDGPPLHQWYGQTESWPTIPLQSLSGCPDALQYLGFHPLMGCSFVELSEGVFEMIITKKSELKPFQACFDVYTEIEEYHTGDLFEPHSEHANYWRFVGRVDDTVLLANGQNLQVVSLEQKIAEHDMVSAVMIGQSGRPWPIVVIEATDEAANIPEEKFIEECWQVIEAAGEKLKNRTGSDALFRRDFLIRINKPQHLPRTSKMTVDRKATLDLLRHEINQMYGFDL